MKQKRSVPTKHHAHEHDWHFQNLQNSNVKFVEKKASLERKNAYGKCPLNSKKHKCDECVKNFTHNIGLKGYITAVHERNIQL